jgi:alpha-mannosidase
MSQGTVHLVCNAHLDPVWLWEWEEGAATAISTFRTAADLCEAYPEFIFNHNEAILYRWVEEYEPALFTHLQDLVKRGQWHIMGGWYLQPDCNMPSGESFVRQILLGRRYFSEKFGSAPTTAINFDSFGHSRGLVQIMVKSGYDSYLLCRPSKGDSGTPGDEFIWEGYDGSRLVVLRPYGWYNTPLGQARQEAKKFITHGPHTPDALMLWGVGNHGGGPSRQDLADLAALMAEQTDLNLCHSTPEAYFTASRKRLADLPVHRDDINPWAVGCYTSQIRVKQTYRRLENTLFATEKMATAAWIQAGMEYPKAELEEAFLDLATCQFHDILPGSSIQPAEEMALRILDHGLEVTTRLKARAFFSLAKEQPPARNGEIPILVYNPHPFPINTVMECEFNLADFNQGEAFTDLAVTQGDQVLPIQVEKELSNLNLDWRKRVVFRAELAPSQMNRFDCHTRPEPLQQNYPPIQGEAFHFQTNDLEVSINTRTGLMDCYRVGGVDYLAANAFAPLVIRDNPDPWGMRVQGFREVLGAFHLLDGPEIQRFSGILNPGLAAVRIIEAGEVRTVVEAVLGYINSRMVMRYKLPKEGAEIEVEVRVHWNEIDRMLKLSLPTSDPHATYYGQTAYGADNLPNDGSEAVAQKWTAILSKDRGIALTIVNNGVYGSDFSRGEARISLLRSPAYSGHPIEDRPILPQDRYSPRMDQGERLYRFWIQGGRLDERLTAIDREALAHNETPVVLSFFPVGGGEPAGAFITLSDEVVLLSALKKAEDGAGLILRLFNPTAENRRTWVKIASLGINQEVHLSAFEIRSFRTADKSWVETDLMENAL